MANLNTQIKVGADSSGVATGLEPGKRALKDFGASADGAGKSLAGMGNGTAQSAQKVEQATKSMIQSIQRTTAATEAGDKSTRAYQESLARMRGIDVAALKPYLDQLDAAKNKAALAATANESFAASFAGIRNAALIASAAIGSFAVAFKKINDGVDALNDLKDATGASIENISALEDVALRSGASFDTVSTSLIKFNGILKDAKPGSDAEQALKALGLSVEEFKRLDPAEALRQTAVAMNSFADDGNKARIAQELFGKSLKDVAPFLKDLAEQGKLNARVTTEQADQAEKFNKELFAMQKNITDVARDLTGPMVTSINEVIKKFKEGREAGRGFFSVGWQNYKDGIGEFYGMKKSEGGSSGSWDSGATGSWGEPAKPSLPPLPDMAAAKSASSAASKALSEYNKELSEQAKLLAELSGLSGSFAGDWERLTAIYQKGSLSLDGLVKAQADLLAKQPAIKAAADAEAKSKEILVKANLSASESHLKYITSIEAGVDKIKADIAAQIEATERMGLSKEAIADLDAAKLEMLATDLELQAIKALDRNLDEQTYNALKKQAQGYRDLAQAKQSGATRETVVNAAKEAAEEWKKTSDSINSTLTDALMRGFESGKDFAKNLRDTAINMFKTMVLRPVISAIMSPVSSAIGGTLGLSGAAQAGQSVSGLSGIASIASGVSSMVTLGSQVVAGTMSAVNALGTVAANATGTGISGLLATNGAFGTAAGAAGASGGVMGALAAIPGWGWAAMAALAVAALAQGGETRSGATYGVGADGKAMKLQGPSGGEIASTQVRGMFDTAKGSIEGMLKGFGSQAVLTGYTAALESSENGKGFAYATGQVNGRAFGDTNTFQNMRGDKTPEQAIKDYQLNLSQSILEALQVTEDLPASVAALIATGLNSSEVKDLSQGAIDGILGTVSKLSGEVNTFNAAMLSMPFEGLKNLSFDAAAGLIAAAGGFEKLDANLGSYYTNFYTSEEQRAQSITQTEAAFTALGLTMPVLDGGARAAYRSLVELAAGQDMTVESNRTAYAGLLALQGPMNQLATTFDAVAQSARDARTAWLDLAKATATASKTAAAAALDIAKNAATEAYATLERAVSAQRKIAEIALGVAQEQMDAIKSVFDTLKSNVQSLYGSVDSTSSMQSAQGQAFITQALIAAQSTGHLPDNTALVEAITAARSGIDGTQFASQSEADFSRLVLAGKLSKLQELAGPQLTAAQQAAAAAQAQIDGLDAILKTAKDQIDVANGIDISIISVADAVNLVNDSVRTLISVTASSADASRQASIKEYVQSTYDTSTPAAEAESLKKISDTALEYGVSMADVARSMGFSLESVQALYKRFNVEWKSSLGVIGSTAPMLPKGAATSSVTTPGVVTVGGGASTAQQAQQAQQGYYTATDLGGWGISRNYITDPGTVAQLDSIKSFVGGAFDGTAQSLAAIAEAAATYGVSQLEIAQATGYTQTDIEKLFSGAGIPAFAVGTNYVPKNMLAQIHEGEAIIPKAYNPAAGGAGGSARLESLVEDLTKEVQRLQSIVNDGNNHARRTADTLDNVTEGGSNMRTVAL